MTDSEQSESSEQSKRLRAYVDAVHDYREWLIEQGLVGPPGMRDGPLRSMLDHIAFGLPLVFECISDVVRSEGDAVMGARNVVEQILRLSPFHAPINKVGWEKWISEITDGIKKIVETEFVFNGFEPQLVESAHEALTSYLTNWIEAHKTLLENGPHSISIAITRIELAHQERGRFYGEIAGALRAKRNLARSGGIGRRVKDPRSIAMDAIRAKFFEWQAGRGPHFDNDAAFARAMVDQFPVLESEGSIKNRCTKWRHEQ